MTETDVRAVPNDDVIEDGDAEELTGADESSRELDVVAARRRVATRVYNLGVSAYLLMVRGFYDEALNSVRSIAEIGT